MNGYARLSHVKADMAGIVTNTVDATYLRAIEAESRAVDQYLKGRHFYSRVDTHYFSGCGAELWLSRDLLSVSSLTVDTGGDGTYETTLTDYDLWPDEPPYRRIDLRGATWPRIKRGIKVVGVWGFSDEGESTGLTGTLTDASDTSLVASAHASALVEVGDTLVTESEQMYVTDVVGTTITVQRGINGTTPVAHSGTALFVRRYPRAIEKAVKLRVLMHRWDIATGVPGSEESRAKYAEYMSLLKPFTPVVI